MEILELRRGLDEFALRQTLVLAHNPWTNLLELFHEDIHVNHQVLDDREMFQRLDPHRSRRELADERLAGELRHPVDHHAAASADSHPAGPSESQRAVE